MVTGYKKNGKFIPTGSKKSSSVSKTTIKKKQTIGVNEANSLLRTKQTTDLKDKKTDSSSDHIGYNVKLKKKEKIQNAKHVMTKNGRHAIKGVGSDGTIMYKFIKAP